MSAWILSRGSRDRGCSLSSISTERANELEREGDDFGSCMIYRFVPWEYASLVGVGIDGLARYKPFKM